MHYFSPQGNFKLMIHLPADIIKVYQTPTDTTFAVGMMCVQYITKCSVFSLLQYIGCPLMMFSTVLLPLAIN